MLRLSLFFICCYVNANAQLPSLYEYYTSDGITTGLSVDQPYFTLNNKNITILGGAIHYFRVPPQHWRDRMRKLRAAGLNTLETYIAWNLHEPQKGFFDFSDGGSDMADFLDLKSYIKMAQEEDLFVIIRPGPFICAEFEFGGLPSWLLGESNITLRTSDETFMKYATRYIKQIIPILEELQFTKGGPIIAVQVENEYGGAPIRDLDYVEALYNLYRDNGIVELLVSSDSSVSGTDGTIPSLIFQTINFGVNALGNLDLLKTIQPGKPFMVMEFWSGWYDHWSESHNTSPIDQFQTDYKNILTYPSSASLYMFIGGTSFGFLNGANVLFSGNLGYQPITTSYDYDAPLTEAGDYTEKYDIVAALVEEYNPIKVAKPERPDLVPRVAYPSITIEAELPYEDFVPLIEETVKSSNVLSMEKLPINNGSGQSYGYIIYRKENIDISAGAVLTITDRIRDTVMVLLNGILVSDILTSSEDLNKFGYYRQLNSKMILTDIDIKNATLDIIVENWSRANFGYIYDQSKGLNDQNRVLIGDKELSDWIIFPLQFKKPWNQKLNGWKEINNDVLAPGPALFKATLTIEEEPADTFVDMSQWTKGILIVNGFVLGRFAFIGPQQTLYLPGPFLQKGANEIVIFEQFKAANGIRFSDNPIYSTT